jgi:hypothetical protein
MAFKSSGARKAFFEHLKEKGTYTKPVSQSSSSSSVPSTPSLQVPKEPSMGPIKFETIKPIDVSAIAPDGKKPLSPQKLLRFERTKRVLKG